MFTLGGEHFARAFQRSLRLKRNIDQVAWRVAGGNRYRLYALTPWWRRAAMLMSKPLGTLFFVRVSSNPLQAPVAWQRAAAAAAARVLHGMHTLQGT